MTKTTLDVLREAREIISAPERWTREVAARDARGEEVHSVADEACCWCALGALNRVTAGFAGVPLYMSARKALTHAAREVAYECVVELNDHGSHEDVLAMFDRAILEAERQQEAAHAIQESSAAGIPVRE